MSHDNSDRREKNPGTGYYKGHDPETEHVKVPASDRKPLQEPAPVPAGSTKISCHRWEH